MDTGSRRCATPLRSIGAQAGFDGVYIGKAGVVEAVEVELEGLALDDVQRFAGMVKCASATWGLPRRLSQLNSNAVHMSAPKNGGARW
jgi:hypothetical protein